MPFYLPLTLTLFLADIFEDVEIDDFTDCELIEDFELLAAEADEQTDYLSS